MATKPEKPGKMSIFRKLSENLEKSGKSAEKHVSQGKVKE